MCNLIRLSDYQTIITFKENIISSQMQDIKYNLTVLVNGDTVGEFTFSSIDERANLISLLKEKYGL
ncbi:MAG: hypothetical protein DI586_08785 [Micavibrio aeruginosavorus]|uniref:Uncharacterized protein n=1 Tax=Micavibrio aeruginosavorus TaxID=349221 RepID=A0A2W5FM10_9BACT|nr:MAG: hypothetical protein DI586_08785 [Micavibrio aeruginosavorus]